MPLRRYNSQSFIKSLYAGQTEDVVLLKRNNDLQEGTVVAFQIFGVRRGNIAKTGQPIQLDMAVSDTTQWIIPNTQLRRIGVNYINVLDRIVDKFGLYWQPETGQNIILSQFDNVTIVDCVRVDPPPGNVLIGIPQFSMGALVVPIPQPPIPAGIPIPVGFTTIYPFPGMAVGPG